MTLVTSEYRERRIIFEISRYLRQGEDIFDFIENADKNKNYWYKEIQRFGGVDIMETIGNSNSLFYKLRKDNPDKYYTVMIQRGQSGISGFFR